MQNVGGENVLVPLGARVMDLNGLVTLNETGACLWELLAEERTPEDLAAALTERFAVDEATAAADVRAFLDGISGLGLLEK